MQLERARVIEIVAAVVALGLMIAIMAVIGYQYTDNGEFASEGGLMLVIAIILFVLVMTVVGYVLAFTVTAEEAAAEASD
ncbi:MAG: hypothetical protein ACLFMX_00725 [Halobacteriales archaeon]